MRYSTLFIVMFLFVSINTIADTSETQKQFFSPEAVKLMNELAQLKQDIAASGGIQPADASAVAQRRGFFLRLLSVRGAAEQLNPQEGQEVLAQLLTVRQQLLKNANAESASSHNVRDSGRFEAKDPRTRALSQSSEGQSERKKESRLEARLSEIETKTKRAARDLMNESEKGKDSPAADNIRFLQAQLRNLQREAAGFPGNRRMKFLTQIRTAKEGLEKVAIIRDKRSGLQPKAGAGDRMLSAPEPATAPTNDNCTSAMAINEGSFTGDTTGATNDGSESCVESLSKDIWYAYTATQTGIVLANTSGSDFDTVLSVHIPPCPGNTGNEMICDDDCGDLTSCVSFAATAGSTYLIRVGGFSEFDYGTVNLDVSFSDGISGTVTEDGTGDPLSDYEVVIYDSDGWVVGFGTTDSSGTYAVALPAGDYFVVTSTYGDYLDEVYDNILCGISYCDPTEGTPVTVTEGSITSNINFALSPGGKISGNLSEEGTGDPIAWYGVDIYDNSGDWVGYGYSDGSGNYTSTALPTGTYYAVTSTYGHYVDELYDDILCLFWNCWPPDGTPIVVTEPNTTAGIDFVLSAGGRISGKLTDQSNGNPLMYYGVDIYDSVGDYAAYGYTDGSGNYISSALTAGTYYAVTYTNGDYLDEIYDNVLCFGYCDPTTGTPISVVSATTTSGIDFALDKAGSISGKVKEAGTKLPLPGVYVDIYDSNGDWITYEFTDGTGNYKVTGLVTGTYYATTWNFSGHIDELYNNIACPFGDCWPPDGTPISVTTGSDTSGINFTLDVGGSISGVLTDASTSDPIIDAYVDIYDSSGSWLTYGYTDGSGNYTVGGFPTGSYFAIAGAEDYVAELYNNMNCPFWNCDPASGTAIPVTKGQNTPGINFALDLGGSISGVLTDASTSDPIVYGYVDIYDTSGDWLAYGYTNALGSYRMGGFPTGTYFAIGGGENHVAELYDNFSCPFWNCDPATGTPISVTIGINTPGINFALDLGGSISGEVTDASSSDPVDTLVYVYDSEGSVAAANWTDDSGQYNVGGLPTGSYYVRTQWSSGTYINELYDNIPCVGSCDVTGGTSVAVTLGIDTPDIDFALDKGGSISGIVTDESGGTPLDSYVDIYDSGGTWVTYGYTDSSGHYNTFGLGEGLTAGSYYAVAWAWQHITELYDDIECAEGSCDPTTGTPISVTQGVNTSGIDFALEAECLFCDDFEDGDLTDPMWQQKGSWNVVDGAATATTFTKADLISTTFGGCTLCDFSSTMRVSAGGRVSFMGWYTKGSDQVEVRLMQDKGKVLAKQKHGGLTNKGIAKMTILPDTDYNLEATYDGVQFHIFLDGSEIIKFNAVGEPFGAISLRVKSGTGLPVTGSYESVSVE